MCLTQRTRIISRLTLEQWEDVLQLVVRLNNGRGDMSL